MAENKEKYTMSFGALPSPYDARDYKLKKDAVCSAACNFPETFELEMRAVKNQGSIGACVAHSIAETIEYHDHRQNGNTAKMSTGFIYGNRREDNYTGTGMYVRNALKQTLQYGDCYLTDFPENVEVPEAINLFENRYENLSEKAYPNRISSFFRVSTAAEIKTALMNYGPVVFAITWYNDMTVDSKGIIHSQRSANESCGGHCMVIYGWDENGWKIQNSWSVFWGKSGKAILPYDFPINEAWGVVDNISNTDDINKPCDNIFGRIVTGVLNFVVSIWNCIKDWKSSK